MPKNSISTRLQKATAVAGVATMLFMVTSCSAGNTQTATSTDSSSASSNEANQPSAKPGDVVKGIPTKTELANNGKGDYIQTTISDDDSAMKFNPALVTTPDASKLFTDAEMEDAQKFVMRYIAEEAIDSQINDNSTDTKNIDDWWAKNKDKMAPQYQDEFLSSLKGDDLTKALVFRTNFRTYSLDYGKDKTRVFDRKLTVDKIQGGTINGSSVLIFDASGSFSMPAVVGESVKQEDTSASFRLSVGKEPSTGKWVIVGAKNTFKTAIAENTSKTAPVA